MHSIEKDQKKGEKNGWHIKPTALHNIVFGEEKKNIKIKRMALLGFLF